MKLEGVHSKKSVYKNKQQKIIHWSEQWPDQIKVLLQMDSNQDTLYQLN